MEQSNRTLRSRIFSLDNKIMQTADKIFNLFVLNMCFVISCLPVITLGPGLVALYRMTDRLREKSVESIGKEYFQTMRDNFRQGMLLGIGISFAAAAIFMNIQIFAGFPQPAGIGLQAFSYGMGMIIFLAGIYAFQISGKFVSSTRQVIKNAFLLSFSNLRESLLLLVGVLPILFLLIYSPFTMLITLSILMSIGFTLLASLQTWILRHLFDKYTNEK